MNRLLISLIILAGAAFSSCAQTTTANVKPKTHADSIKVYLQSMAAPSTAPYYKLYPTANMWTFLELETFSGRIWQVQYSIKGSEYRFRSKLNECDLALGENEFAGRFELYKTENMYNFVLLDTATGATYQVQWSTEAENRWILPIL